MRPKSSVPSSVAEASRSSRDSIDVGEVAMAARHPSPAWMYLRRVFSFVSVIGVSGLVLVAFHNEVISVTRRRLDVEILVLSVALATAMWILASRRQDPTEHVFDTVKSSSDRKAQRPTRTREPVTLKEVQNATREFMARIDEKSVLRLAELMSQSARHILRIQETLECTDSEWTTTTVRTIHTPDDGTLLVPVLRHRKGELIDGLSVEHAGQPMSTLNHTEFLGAIAMVLGTLFQAAFKDKARDRAYSLALRQILEYVGGRSVIGTWEKSQLENAMATLDWTPDEREPEKQVFRDLVSLLEDRFLVIAVISNCRAGERIKVKTKSCVLDRDEDSSIHAWVRRLLGLQRRTYRIAISEANETASYHFYTKSPAGTYYEAPKIEAVFLSGDSSIATQLRADVEIDLKSRVKTSTISGSDSVHVHIADLGEVVTRWGSIRRIEFYLSTNFRERPPGVVGVQWWMSLYILILTWLAGFNYDRIFASGTTSSSQGIDLVWSALFFGVPVLVAPWITSKLIMERLRVISVATYALLVWLIGDAIVTTFLAGIIFVSGAKWSLNVGSGVSVIHVAWAVLMISTAAQSGMSFANLWRKSARLGKARLTSA
jgi:hypothetical protein